MYNKLYLARALIKAQEMRPELPCVILSPDDLVHKPLDEPHSLLGVLSDVRFHIPGATEDDIKRMVAVEENKRQDYKSWQAMNDPRVKRNRAKAQRRKKRRK